MSEQKYSLCLKIIYLYFSHINQNFNVLLYKSFNKFPSDTKVTIKDRQPHAHSHHMDTCTRAHACSHTHEIKSAILDLALGRMEQFALICWFGWPCSAKQQFQKKKNNNMFCRMTSLSLKWAASKNTISRRNKGYIRPHRHKPHGYLHTYAVMAGICDC